MNEWIIKLNVFKHCFLRASNTAFVLFGFSLCRKQFMSPTLVIHPNMYWCVWSKGFGSDDGWALHEADGRNVLRQLTALMVDVSLVKHVVGHALLYSLGLLLSGIVGLYRHTCDKDDKWAFSCNTFLEAPNQTEIVFSASLWTAIRV